MKRLIIVLGLVSLAAVLAACSGSSAAPATGDPVAPSASAPTSDAVTITAKDLKFGQTEVTVPAGEAFELVLDNQEGAPHNVAIYTDPSASTKVSIGDIFSGPAQKSQSVPALAAGTYSFRCDVHPEMTGTILAE